MTPRSPKINRVSEFLIHPDGAKLILEHFNCFECILILFRKREVPKSMYKQ